MNPHHSLGTAMPQLQPAQGAYTHLEHLVSCRFLAQALQLVPQRQAMSAMMGPNKTRFRGRGIDFEEVRAYQAGDDIRTIDWRVTARSGVAHTKLYKEERERPVMIAVDQRQSLFFGSRCCFKSVLAAELTALLAWAALANGDRVGGAVFSGHDYEFKPKRNHQAVLHLLQKVHEANTALHRDSRQHHALEESFQQLNRIVRPGSAVFLISDFMDLDENSLKPLHQLARHNDITAFFVYDPMEQQLPPPGRYQLSNGLRQWFLDSQPIRTREQYHQDFAARQNRITHLLGQLGIVTVPVATTDIPFTVLSRCLGQQSRRHRGR